MLADERRHRIGSADAPVIMGVNKWKDPQQLWLEKTGQAQDDIELTPAMERGIMLEPIAANLFARETGRNLQTVTSTISHPDIQYITATPDRMQLTEAKSGYGTGCLEIKTFGLKTFGEIQRQGLPDYCIIQGQHQLGVTGCRWGSFAILNPERWKLIHFDFERDDELIAIIFAKCRAFWKQVIEHTPPEPLERPVVELPPVGGKVFEMGSSPQWARAVEDLRMARDLAEEASQVEAQAKAKVQELMARVGADVAEGAGARVYWKEQSGRKTFDYKKFLKDHPEMNVADYWKHGGAFRSMRTYFTIT